jgi:hypothetical protein
VTAKVPCRDDTTHGSPSVREPCARLGKPIEPVGGLVGRLGLRIPAPRRLPPTASVTDRSSLGYQTGSGGRPPPQLLAPVAGDLEVNSGLPGEAACSWRSFRAADVSFPSLIARLLAIDHTSTGLWMVGKNSCMIAQIYYWHDVAKTQVAENLIDGIATPQSESGSRCRSCTLGYNRPRMPFLFEPSHQTTRKHSILFQCRVTPSVAFQSFDALRLLTFLPSSGSTRSHPAPH